MSEERKHAILSASGAKRWLACPPSAQLEEILPEAESEYAEEGTFAHAYAELQLKKALGYINKREFKKQSDILKQNTFYSQALEDYIQGYTTMVMERVAEAKSRCKDSIVMLEQKLDFSQWVPEGFGTGDVVIISDSIMEVIDLKYGKGVQVSAIDNPQLKLYGLGALNQFGTLFDIAKVRITIIQPRLDNISSDIIDAGDLYEWAEDYVAPRAAQAMAGEGEYEAGDHCRFCKVKAQCKKRADMNLELAKYDFKDSTLLTDDEMVDILNKADEFLSWLRDVQAFALDQAENHGKKWLGYKLVEGRSNRAYSDKVAVADTLLIEGYSENDIYEKSLIGITAMEKLLGKKKFEELLGELIVKPAGKPTLVPESDKRPEINSLQSAINDFLE